MAMRWRIVAAAAALLSGVACASERTPLVTGMRDGARLALGGAHSCVVGSDGNVRCWGANASGQLGDGTTTDRRTPVLVANLTQVVSVAAGTAHTCALRAAGTVHCWGSSANDQIGPGTASRSTPLQVAGLAGIVSITAGARHSCALDGTGVVRCWGDNTQGQLGRAGTGTAAVDLDDVVAIGAGAEHTCAVDVRGDAWCWGRNTDDQLGAGDGSGIGLFEPLPVPVRFSGTTLPGIPSSGFVAITGGASHTCGLRAGGNAMCWGASPFGQVGDGGTDTHDTPQDVINVNDAISLATGNDFGCAVRVGGVARCWGRGTDGQLGNGTASDRFSSVSVQSLDNAVQIAAGGRHACALRADGSVRCWGDNASGQLGNNSLSRRTSPVAVTGITGGIGATAIAMNGHACALRGDGTVACWGGNGTGGLGDGTTVSTGRPVAVAGVANATHIAVGSGHGCARIADGSVRCWGRNDNGQVGDGTTITPRLAAVTVPNVGDVMAVAAGSVHTCVLRAGGGMLCWGDNQHGQLGNLSTTDSATPRTPLLNTPTPTPLRGVVAIAAAAVNTCARLVSGDVACWGRNDVGQLGINSTTTPQTSPRNMSTSEVVTVAAANHACVVRANGAVACTGGNAAGQLGDGTTTNRQIPFTATGAGPVAALAVGAFHTCGVRTSGRAVCWGDNDFGQLGDGTTTDHLTATQIPSLANLTAVGASGLASCAIDAAGQPFCWGAGGSGILGDGTFGDHRTPIAVPSFTMNVDPVVALTGPRSLDATVIALCEADASLVVNVTLLQGSAIAQGHAIERCTGARERYPLTLHTQGKDRFVPGPARAELEASVRVRGRIVDTQQWSRSVTVVDTAAGSQ